MLKRKLFLYIIVIIIFLSGCSNQTMDNQEQLSNFDVIEKEVMVPTLGGSLGATLALPKGASVPVKAVIIVPGGGPLDRDGNVLQSSVKMDIFKQISHYLTSKGIATLRYDKRGVAQSAGLIKNDEDPLFNDYAADVEACIEFLKTVDEVNSQKIFIAGHSEGTLFTSQVAGERKDLAGVVLISGLGVKYSEAIKEQMCRELDIFEQSQGVKVKEQTLLALDDLIQAVVNDQPFDISKYELPEMINSVLQEFLIRRDYYKEALQVDPVKLVEDVNAPICIIHGTADQNVPFSQAEILLNAVKHKEKEIHIIDGMSHTLNKIDINSTEGAKAEIEVEDLLLSSIESFIKKY